MPYKMEQKHAKCSVCNGTWRDKHGWGRMGACPGGCVGGMRWETVKVWVGEPKRSAKGQGKGGDQKTGGCFIATAAYGSPLASEVELFRQFRDRSLLTSKAGAAAVAFYYSASPPLARLIAERPLLKIAVRNLLLDPLARVLKRRSSVADAPPNRRREE